MMQIARRRGGTARRMMLVGQFRRATSSDSARVARRRGGTARRMMLVGQFRRATSSDSARVARPDDAGSPIALSELPAPATRLRFTSSDSARQLPA